MFKRSCSDTGGEVWWNNETASGGGLGSVSCHEPSRRAAETTLRCAVQQSRARYEIGCLCSYLPGGWHAGCQCGCGCKPRQGLEKELSRKRREAAAICCTLSSFVHTRTHGARPSRLLLTGRRCGDSPQCYPRAFAAWYSSALQLYKCIANAYATEAAPRRNVAL